jgi:hypothetical protein
MKQFNINDTVKVKLTEYGKRMLKRNHFYVPSEEDENGYVKFQLWSLIYQLGEYGIFGCEPLFGAVILIDENNLRDVE